MDKNLTPTYKNKYGKYWVLWFKVSNIYSVIDDSFNTVLDFYFLSKSSEEFYSSLENLALYGNVDCQSLLNTIKDYLNKCNTLDADLEKILINIDKTKNNISKTYTINNQNIKINFDSKIVVQIIHPALAYLETNTLDSFDTIFDIYLKDSHLYLYKNKNLITRVPKQDYHLLQGKFIMHLLCSIHNKKEDDWIGTFHGSTISNNESAIMFIGISGKGKSTLTSLLAANGLELLADDVSPLLAEDMEIYNNPSAVSIKKGSFSTIKPLIKEFDALATVNFNTSKGYIKYIPFTNHTKFHYPCKSIILVNYQKNAELSLENASIQDVLETLIPDSWLNHNSVYAKKFLDWLSNLHFYKLTYSNNDNAIKAIKTLFKQFKSA